MESLVSCLDLVLSRCSQTLREPRKVAGIAKAVVIPQGSQASGALAGRRFSDF